MARTTTVKDVAQRAQVSIATVSRVLNNQGNTTEELRQRVLQAAAELGYFKASRAEKRILKEIGFLLIHSDLDEAMGNTFWAQILRGAEIEARKSNIYLTYRSIPLSQALPQLLNMLHEMRVGGIMLVGPASSEIVQSIQQTGIPLVLVDNYVHGFQVDAVFSDNFEGTREAVTYLISKGHQHIAFLGGYTTSTPSRIYSFEQRKAGYLSALQEAGQVVQQSLIEEVAVSDPNEIRAACQRLLATGIAFSALFCVNDETAMWAIKHLRELGVNVPEDISVVGFDDIDLAAYLTPPLTTMRVYKEAMGAAAVKTLLARISDPQPTSVTSILGVQLIERGSVA